MCGRFNQKEKTDLSEEFKGQSQGQVFYNIAPAMFATIIISKDRTKGIFGLKPAWDKEKKLLFINARVEGKDNDQNKREGWELGIHKMPTFRTAFSKRRCVIPVTGFLEGPEKEKLSRPYLISAADNREFYLGGIYELFIDTETGEEIPTFAIITTPSNDMTAFVGHHRTPLILDTQHIETWLDTSAKIEDITSIVKSGYVEPGMKVTPLFPELVKSGRNHDAGTMKEAGESVLF